MADSHAAQKSANEHTQICGKKKKKKKTKYDKLGNEKSVFIFLPFVVAEIARPDVQLLIETNCVH